MGAVAPRARVQSGSCEAIQPAGWPHLDGSMGGQRQRQPYDWLARIRSREVVNPRHQPASTPVRPPATSVSPPVNGCSMAYQTASLISAGVHVFSNRTYAQLLNAFGPLFDHHIPSQALFGQFVADRPKVERFSG